MLEIKIGKQHVTEGVDLPNQVIRALGEKETNKYLGILESETIKQQKMKEKIFKKEYLRRARKLFETKIYSRNLVKCTNT